MWTSIFGIFQFNGMRVSSILEFVSSSVVRELYNSTVPRTRDVMLFTIVSGSHLIKSSFLDGQESDAGSAKVEVFFQTNSIFTETI